MTSIELSTIDCIEGMRRLADNSVDVVVTSPPYNLGINYRNYRDKRKSQDYLEWSVQWATEVRRVLAENGSFFLNLGACPSDPMLPHELIVRMRGNLFELQNTFHWIKSISIQTPEGKIISAGHFKPIQSDRFVTDCHEFVFHLTKTGTVTLHRRAIGVPYTHKSNISRWGHTQGRDLRCRGNNWFIPYQTIKSQENDRPHPATFPVDLAVFCLKIHGCRKDLTVLDPFVGIGHSAIAAKQCDVGRFIGFDIDDEYIKVARRMSQADKIDARPKAPKPGRKRKGDDSGLLFDLPAS